MGKHVQEAPARLRSVAGTASVVFLTVAVVVSLLILSTRGAGVRAAGADLEVSTSSVAPPAVTTTPKPEKPKPTKAQPEPDDKGDKSAPGRRFANQVEKTAAEPPPEPTVFRVTSFNILGHSHTLTGARARKFPSGPTRAGYVVDLINGWSVDVAGLQELQAPQWSVIARRLPGWGHYGPALGREVMANSIIWDASKWEAVETRTIQIPYFGGNRRAMPYVLLRNLASGQLVWFANFHNPADARGPAQRWRNAATAIQIGLANTLTADGTPLVFTGDFNDREEYFCPIVGNTLLESSSGGSFDGGCATPGQMDVDWIFGSPPIQFTNHVRVIDGLIDRTTDHPMIVADAFIPAQGLESAS